MGSCDPPAETLTQVTDVNASQEPFWLLAVDNGHPSSPSPVAPSREPSMELRFSGWK